MAKPVNLNRVRKAWARAERKAQAEENAVRFGRYKAEKERDATQAEQAARLLDLHKREP